MTRCKRLRWGPVFKDSRRGTSWNQNRVSEVSEPVLAPVSAVFAGSGVSEAGIPTDPCG